MFSHILFNKFAIIYFNFYPQPLNNKIKPKQNLL